MKLADGFGGIGRNWLVGALVLCAPTCCAIAGKPGAENTVARNEPGGVPEECALFISSIPDVVFNPCIMDYTDLILFTVGGAKTATEELVLSVNSSDETVIPVKNVQFGGTGSSRAMIILPAPNKLGQAEITLTVRDGEGCASSTSFKVTVLGPDPTLSPVPDQSVEKNGTTGPIPFSINPGGLCNIHELSATSSNPEFVRPDGIIIQGNTFDSTRTITVTPVSEREGASTITIAAKGTWGPTNTASFLVSTPPEAEWIRVQDQQVEIGVRGAPGTALHLETSTDLTTWTPLNRECGRAAVLPATTGEIIPDSGSQPGTRCGVFWELIGTNRTTVRAELNATGSFGRFFRLRTVTLPLP